MILKRIVIFRLVFYGSAILTVGSFLQANKATESVQSVTPSFFIQHGTLAMQRFKLSGIVKHGSIEMKKGNLENRFILTDFKNDITVVYKGALPAAFKEGDMAQIGGFLADHKNPTCFIGTSVMANHEIEPDRWVGETNVERIMSLNMV